MKLPDLFRRWLAQSDIAAWEDFSSELAKKCRDKEARLQSEAEAQHWRLNTGADPFLTLAAGLEIKPLGGGKFEKRGSEGLWAKANPRKDFPPADLVPLQKLSDSFIEVVLLRQASQDLPPALEEFKREFQRRLDTLRDAQSPVMREDALGQLRAFYDAQQEVLPVSSRKELLVAEFQTLFHAFRDAVSAKETGDLQTQLRDFFRRHPDMPSCEAEFVAQEHLKEFRARLDALRHAGSPDEAGRAKAQLLVFADKCKENLPAVATAEIESAWNHCLANIGPPALPTGLKASGGRSEGIQVSWNSSQGAVEYQVFRSDSSALETKSYLDSIPASPAVPSPSPAFLDSSAAPGRDYFYWVNAKNPKGESDFIGPAKGCRPKPPDQVPEPAPKTAAPETTARMMKALEEGDVLEAIRVYSLNPAHADVWIGLLDEALVICLENAQRQMESAGAPVFAGMLSNHKVIQKKLRELLKTDRNPSRLKALSRISARNNDFIAGLEEHLKGLNLADGQEQGPREEAKIKSQAQPITAEERPGAQDSHPLSVPPPVVAAAVEPVPPFLPTATRPIVPGPDPNPMQRENTIGQGRFVLIKEIGRGGMGVVWQAEDQRLKEPVALKFLPPEIKADFAALDGLRRETARSHKLTHANIVRIHDFHEPINEFPFISMEFVNGQTLDALRQAQPDRVLRWGFLQPLAGQLCSALDYAHGEGVVHRDLKPANLMVDDKGRLKLADFGIAAMLNESMTRVTRQNPTSGTLLFMSPQQFEGRPSAAADDIYSLGATLYSLLTGTPPFFRGDIAHQLLNTPAQPLDRRLTELNIQNEVPVQVRSVIMACLAKNAEDRPKSARDVAEGFKMPVTLSEAVTVKDAPPLPRFAANPAEDSPARLDSQAAKVSAAGKDAQFTLAVPRDPASEIRLELRDPDGTRIGILTQSAVRIGRQRDCEILARVLDKEGREMKAESQRIGQYHALVEWHPDSCRLRDGGLYPADGWRRSQAGVWVDGKRVPAEDGFNFLPGRDHRIVLGGLVGNASNRYELSAMLWTAKDLPQSMPAWPEVALSGNTPVCLVLRRLNGPGWVYLLLRSCASLAWADLRCGGAWVRLHQGSLQLTDGHACESLVPGRAVRAGSLNFQVINTLTTR